jgi:nucleoside-diphosphate-sugar epimerase
MQNALVTGATGFIGGHLTESLVRRGVNVRCLVRATSNTKHLAGLGVKLIEGDVTRPDSLSKAVDGVEVVFHLAGLITALRKQDMWKANAESPGSIAAACSHCDTPPALVLLSSVAAAGPADSSLALQETDSPAPVSEYGRSKRAGEIAAEAWSRDVPITIVRPGIIFGPRDRLTLPIFKTIATWGVHPVVGFGKTKIAMLHVEDLVELLLAVADRGERLPANKSQQPGTGVFFAADENAPSYHELGLLIARAMDRRVIPLPSPPALAWSAAAASQLCSQLIRRATPVNFDKIREARQPSWAISSAKAQQQLGWSPQASLEERLRETVDWYIEQDWLKVRRLFAPPSRTGVW